MDQTPSETPGGGAAFSNFSNGSIDWITAFSHEDHDSNAACVTHNVLRRFLGDAADASRPAEWLGADHA